MNLVNPPGTFSATTTNYQNIYQYTINSGPLPWTSFPTVITNPIGIGTVNQVIVDAEIAPDGKYFLCTERLSASDGKTNVCVLNSAGTAVLWDSKTQSASYFHDSNDHCSIVDYFGLRLAGRQRMSSFKSA